MGEYKLRYVPVQQADSGQVFFNGDPGRHLEGPEGLIS